MGMREKYNISVQCTNAVESFLVLLAELGKDFKL
jgi:hypothetical protein